VRLDRVHKFRSSGTVLSASNRIKEADYVSRERN
jgi:hypothetical protein